MFEDFKTVRKNSLMRCGAALTGTTMEQLKTIWAEVEDQYRSYTTSNQWSAAASAFYKGNSGTGGVKCDNCGGNHYSNKCPAPRDEARISCNREARLVQQQDKPKEDGNNVTQNGRGTGKSLTGHRGYSRQGKFGPPQRGEIVCQIHGKIHAACKICGLTTGPIIHTTGQHNKAKQSNYQPCKTLCVNIAKLENGESPAGTSKSGGGDDSNQGGNEEKKPSVGGAFPLRGSAATLDKMEKEEESPEAAMFAAHFGKFLAHYLKE